MRLGVIVIAHQRPRADQAGAQDRRLAVAGDLLQLAGDLRDPGGVLAATAGLDEVEHGRPAHEAVKRRVVLVEHRPERAECLVVPSLAESRGAPGEVRGGEQRPTVHRGQCSLRLGEHRIEVGFATAQRSGQRAHELPGESELRLASVARQDRRLGARRARPLPNRPRTWQPTRSGRAPA